MKSNRGKTKFVRTLNHPVIKLALQTNVILYMGCTDSGSTESFCM